MEAKQLRSILYRPFIGLVTDFDRDSEGSAAVGERHQIELACKISSAILLVLLFRDTAIQMNLQSH